MKKTPHNITMYEACNNYEGIRDKTHDLLTILKDINGILRLTKANMNAGGINKTPVDYFVYLYLHQLMHAKWRQYIECTSMQGEYWT